MEMEIGIECSRAYEHMKLGEHMKAEKQEKDADPPVVTTDESIPRQEL